MTKKEEKKEKTQQFVNADEGLVFSLHVVSALA